MLQMTASRPVYLGIKHSSGTYDQISISLWQLRSCFCGAPSLTRGRVCLLYLLLVLASVVFLLGPSPFGFVTIFYSLIFETSLFVASYDTQGHGGGIRPRLHMCLSLSLRSSLYNLRKHRFHRYSLTIPRLLLASSLPWEPVYRVVV
jgi:hypothetical protein